jgi:hypothetical protein
MAFFCLLLPSFAFCFVDKWWHCQYLLDYNQIMKIRFEMVWMWVYLYVVADFAVYIKWAKKKQMQF